MLKDRPPPKLSWISTSKQGYLTGQGVADVYSKIVSARYSSSLFRVGDLQFSDHRKRPEKNMLPKVTEIDPSLYILMDAKMKLVQLASASRHEVSTKQPQR